MSTGNKIRVLDGFSNVISARVCRLPESTLRTNRSRERRQSGGSRSTPGLASELFPPSMQRTQREMNFRAILLYLFQPGFPFQESQVETSHCDKVRFVLEFKPQRELNLALRR